MGQSSPHRRGQEAQFYHVHKRGTPGLLATGANDHHLPVGFMCPLFSLGHLQRLLWAASLPCSPRFYPVFLSLSSNFPWTSSLKPISVPSGLLHFQSQCHVPNSLLDFPGYPASRCNQGMEREGTCLPQQLRGRAVLYLLVPSLI